MNQRASPANPNSAVIIAAMRIALGWPPSCLVRSLPKSPSDGRARNHDAGGRGDEQRGNLRDDAFTDREQREVLQRLQQRHAAAAATPMMKPPTMLIATMMSAAIASPRTNLLAPSIAP